MIKAPLITEPTAILVKRNPRLEALRCNSFKPTTGINDGLQLPETTIASQSLLKTEFRNASQVEVFSVVFSMGEWSS
jgi:hypothetical protein